MSTVRRKSRPATAAPPWEDVLAGFSDAVIVTDADTVITLFNQAAEELTGLPQRRAVGQRAAEVFARVPVLVQVVAHVLESGAGASRGEEELDFATRSVPARVVGLPIFDSADRVRGATLVIHDLSHQKRLEESARRNESLAHLGTLVAGLAHEIRNPLAGINGAAQLLERRLAAQPELREYTQVITREASRLTALMEDLLGLGAPPAPRLQPLNVHRVIQHVVSLFEAELTRRGFHLGCEFDPSLPDIAGDESQLSQVLLNLIKNAMEAMTTDGTVVAGRDTIVIRTRIETDFRILRHRHMPGQYLRVEVADQGCGIDPASASRLFEPFFTTKARGTGLGLAISHRIVAEHGGIIGAEPNRPFGTVFTVTLPVAAR